MNEPFDPEALAELLVEKLPDFERRESQLEMLTTVAKSFADNHISLIEAGTGTGKSVAYLLPALLWAKVSGERTVVSTHTIALQEQLLHKDIPLLLETFDLPLKVELLKGMRHYVCLRRLDEVEEERGMEGIARWARKTTDGSKASLPWNPPAEVWDQVCAEAESCTHVKCPHYKECFFFKARRAAADAHILIVNHHLLFADLALRRQSEGEEQVAIFPAYERLVLDEAHHVEDVATELLAARISRWELHHLIGRLLKDRGGKLNTLKGKLPDGHAVSTLLELDIPIAKRDVADAVERTFDEIALFLGEQREEKFRLRSTHLESRVWQDRVCPAVESAVRLGMHFVHSVDGLLRKLEGEEELAGLCADIQGIVSRLERAFATLEAIVFEEETTDRVRWIEKGETLIAADLAVAPTLETHLFAPLSTAILTSATLAMQHNFSYFKKRLGIVGEPVEQIHHSPFDFERQMLLAVPNDLPLPNAPHFTEEACTAIWRAIEVSQGNAFVLFTSYQMLKECAERLRESLECGGYTLLCQGEERRQVLLQQFREEEGAVLFGTDSFWEGVDVAGEALRCVIIAKLPFKVPTEPLVAARAEALEAEGKSSFWEYSLPQAVMKFKQGVGRLIRTCNDRGAIVCLDTRLLKKGYGKVFFSSLPPCRYATGTQEEVFTEMAEFYALSGSPAV